MEEPTAVVFDPDWRDDVLDHQALEISLALPDPMPRSGHIWIEVRAMHHETIFGQQHTYKPYRLETAILKPSEMAQQFALADENGRAIAPVATAAESKAVESIQTTRLKRLNT